MAKKNTKKTSKTKTPQVEVPATETVNEPVKGAPVRSRYAL